MTLPPLGAIPDPPEVVAILEKRVLPRIHFLPEELPESVDLSDGLPPVACQVSGSCVAWAVGYNNKTHDEFCEFGWNLNSSNHQFSANYIYNQRLLRDDDSPPEDYRCGWYNVGDDCGMFAYEAYEHLMDEGCCSRTHFPTTNQWAPVPDDCKEYAKPYKISDYGLTRDWHTWREILANGKMLSACISWCSNCDHPQPTDHYIIDTPLVDANNPRGSHMICICGYDFDINGTGISGFKFVNSHGSWYGDDGFAWLSENFINTVARCWGYWMTDQITPPSNLRVVDMCLVWDGPSDITYEIYDESFNIIGTTRDTMYCPVAVGTYGIGASGSECLETITIDECSIPACIFGVD
jgi:hypothetical protein